LNKNTPTEVELLAFCIAGQELKGVMRVQVSHATHEI